MTATQSTQRHGATLRRAACRAAAALRAIHDEQVLIWELIWQSSRVPVDRAGPLAWTPSLDGPRLTGRHLPSPDEPQAARRPQTTAHPAPRPAAAAAAAGQAQATAEAEVSTSGDPAHYEIRVEGILDNRWAAWFGGLHIERDDTQTVISGSLADQPALHGLLTKIRDLGLCLICIPRLDPD